MPRTRSETRSLRQERIQTAVTRAPIHNATQTQVKTVKGEPVATESCSHPCEKRKPCLAVINQFFARMINGTQTSSETAAATPTARTGSVSRQRRSTAHNMN